jgi:hypothetical protein
MNHHFIRIFFAFPTTWLNQELALPSRLLVLVPHHVIEGANRQPQEHYATAAPHTPSAESSRIFIRRFDLFPSNSRSLSFPHLFREHHQTSDRYLCHDMYPRGDLWISTSISR